MKGIKYIIVALLCGVITGKALSQDLYEVTPLAVSTNYSNELAAVPFRDGIIYCSDRNVHVLISKTDTDNRPLFHLYYSQRKDSARWGAPQLLTDLASDTHQCPCTVSSNNQEIYYTISVDERRKEIYSAKRNGDGWTYIRPFINNRKNFSNIHPSLSADGKRMFYASDMPGGYGGMDIYYCDMTPRGWGAPQNLGPEVNGPDDELYPTIQPNGTLYFSSYGHNSMGGLDIFSVVEINGKWTLRKRLPPPINSEKNDFSYTLVDDVVDAYFSSDRRGTLDIYEVNSLFPVFATCAPQEENEYSYEFFEPGTVDLDTTTFRYEWNMGDGTIVKGQTAEHTFQSVGEYFIQLNVVDTLTGEHLSRVASYLFEVLDIEQPYITSPDSVAVGKPITLDAFRTFLPELEIEEYYWYMGDDTKLTGEQVTHIYAVPGTYHVMLGVIGTSRETGKRTKACSSREITVHQ